MQKAENILRAIRKLGINKQPLTRVYRNLYCEELYMLAYDRLAKNQGALTRGDRGRRRLRPGLDRHRPRGVTGRDRVLFCGYHGWHDWYQAANYGVDPQSGEYPFAGIEPIEVKLGQHVAEIYVRVVAQT